MKKSKQYGLFLVSGSLGFLCDTGIFQLISSFVNCYWSRMISFVFAVCLTWLLNRNFTFITGKPASYWIEFVNYLQLMILGGVLNLAVFFWLMHTVKFCMDHPSLAIASGSMAGMCLNYFTSQRLLAAK
jgi:putative flippase GtrA